MVQKQRTGSPQAKSGLQASFIWPTKTLAELGQIGLIQVTGLVRLMTQNWPLFSSDCLANQSDVLRQYTRPRMSMTTAPLGIYPLSLAETHLEFGGFSSLQDEGRSHPHCSGRPASILPSQMKKLRSREVADPGRSHSLLAVMADLGTF